MSADTYICFLQINLAGKLFAYLIQCPSAPVSKPVQHTSTGHHHHRLSSTACTKLCFWQHSLGGNTVLTNFQSLRPYMRPSTHYVPLLTYI